MPEPAQCGFASSEEGNALTEEQQWAKLKMIVEVADEVWGMTEDGWTVRPRTRIHSLHPSSVVCPPSSDLQRQAEWLT